MKQINDTDAFTRKLVFIARTDTAAGRTDFFLVLGCLVQRIKQFVVGHDKMSVVAYKQPPLDIVAKLFHLSYFVKQGIGIDNNSVTDNAGTVFMKNP